jgi:hypothetical protein
LARKRPEAAADESVSASADAAAIAAALWQVNEAGKTSALSSSAPEAGKESRWKTEGRRAQVDRTP